MLQQCRRCVHARERSHAALMVIRIELVVEARSSSEDSTAGLEVIGSTTRATQIPAGHGHTVGKGGRGRQRARE